MVDLSTLFCNCCFHIIGRGRWNNRFCSPDCVTVYQFRQQLKGW